MNSFITLEQLITTYMIKFNTRFVSKKELKRWQRHYLSRVTTNEESAIKYYNERYAKKERYDATKFFVLKDDIYYLANGVTRLDLDNKVLAYMHVDLIMKMFGVSNFKPKRCKISSMRSEHKIFGK